MPKHLSILGSTGSIGRNAVHIAEMHPEDFRVLALAAKDNISRLARQIESLCPEMAVVIDEKTASALKKMLPSTTSAEILFGESGYRAAATHPGVDQVVAAMVGSAGLMPTLAAIDAGKDIALANKETLVMAGSVVMDRAKAKKVRILPIDSEHSAIFQCLLGHDRAAVTKILLTASGGPFLRRSREDFETIQAADALNHPTWSMGPKISVDSASLMNKGLEVIEAKWLFDVSPDMIEVVIHPQSVIHSMVAFRDGAVLAQLGIPDMKGAIAYALSYPDRLELKQSALDLVHIGALSFEAPDLEKFPCLSLAFDVIKTGGTLPAVLNAANEVTVSAFLEGRLRFLQIPVLIGHVLDAHRTVQRPLLDDILEADAWARRVAADLLPKMG